MDLQERLDIFIKHLGITHRLFENYAGLANGAARTLKSNMRKGTSERISKAFPNLNLKWLLTGEGEMLIKPNGGGVIATQNNIGKAHGVQHNTNGNWEDLLSMLKTKDELIEKQQRTIDRLLSLLEKERCAT